MGLGIAIRTNAAATIVDITGGVTLTNVPELLKVLMDLLKMKRVPRVVVNMTNVKYLDSAGVAGFVQALKVARDLKLGFALYGLGHVAKEVFVLTRLITVFEVYGTEEEALRGAPPASSRAAV